MKKLTLRNAVLLLALCCLAAGAASATSVSLQSLSNSVSLKNGTVVVPFPTAGDAYCSQTNGCGTIPSGGQTDYMWTAGDFVASSVFVIPGALNVTGLTANWQYEDQLGEGGNESWFVFVNNVAVASFTIPDCGFCGSIGTVSGSVSFAGIAPSGGGWQVALILQNTVPFGEGSAAFLDGGMTGLDYTTSTVPEPGTLVLLGSSLLGFAGIVRRKLIG
jgi:PEP-CTERM motif